MGRYVFASAAAAVLMIASTALGLCEIKYPLSKVWKMSGVSVGTIESTRDGNHILTVRLRADLKDPPAKGGIAGGAAATEPGGTKTGRGDGGDETLTVQIFKPEELCARIATEQPIVIVRSGIKDILINVADDWYQAQAGNTPGILRIIALREDFRGTFTGHTSALIHALDELKAGKYTLLDERPARFLSTQVKLGAVTGVKDVETIASGTDKQGRTLVYIRTAEGANVFVLKDGMLERGDDEAAGKEFVSRHVIAPEEMDKSPLLKHSLSVARGGFGDEGGRAALALQANGLVRVMDGEKSDAKSDDDIRLIGSKLTEYMSEWKEGIKDAVISTCDVNGDGRDDAVIVSKAGTLVLVNRGFGIFLVAKADGEAFKGALAATGDPASGGLLVLRRGDDGTIELWRSFTPNP